MRAVAVGVIAFVAVLGGCAAEPADSVLPESSPSATATITAPLAPEQRVPGGCAAQVDVTLVEALVPGATLLEGPVTPQLLQSGADECVWSGAGSLAVGVLADGTPAFEAARATAGSAVLAGAG